MNEGIRQSPQVNQQLWQSATDVDPRIRMRVAGSRGTLVLVRQSGDEQAANNVGSQLMQRDRCLTSVLDCGIANDMITVVEAFGEQASKTDDRKLFQQCLEMIEAGQVGLVVSPMIHRVTRNVPDALSLLHATGRAGALLFIDNRLLDPTSPEDECYIVKASADARKDVASWTQWRTRAKLTLARRCAARIKLPTGLVWADPNDRNYRHAMEKAGLMEWLSIPAGTRACSLHQGRRFYILPFPDAEVFAAVTLQIRWLLETGSVREVVRRIRDGHPGWPAERVGLVPRVVTEKRSKSLKVKWKGLDANNFSRSLEPAALYGIYRFHSEAESHPSLKMQRKDQRKSSHFERNEERRRPPLSSMASLLAHGNDRNAT